jgi:hypothetical protein
MRPLTPPPEADEYLSRVGLVNRRQPGQIMSLDNNVLLHVSRLCILLRIVGKPKNQPALYGRTKLAKIDFFIRYPQYLKRAIEIEGIGSENQELLEQLSLSDTVESRMVRYRYGPWDQRYYVVLAYMTGKKLIEIVTDDKVDKFVLLERGIEHADTLMDNPLYRDLVIRTRLVDKVFGSFPGNRIKDFIYQNFPEVVRTPYNQYMPKA